MSEHFSEYFMYFVPNQIITFFGLLYIKYLVNYQIISKIMGNSEISISFLNLIGMI